jgi:hypothetical protein
MIISRRATPRGEVVLRLNRGAYEIICNGVFVMSSAEVTSERLLAEETIARVVRAAGLRERGEYPRPTTAGAPSRLHLHFGEDLGPVPRSRGQGQGKRCAVGE